MRSQTAYFEQSSWLLCRAATRLCALPIDNVIEITRPRPVEHIPGAPNFVRGMAMIRGEPVAVVDIGLLLESEPVKAERFVMIKTERAIVALAVEDIVGTQPIGPEIIGDLPTQLRDTGSEAIAAIGMLDGELLVLLRTAKLIPELVLKRLNRMAPA